jgi:CTP:phosphocholine cytidylyltransferase-like protein
MAPFPVYDTEYVEDVENKIKEIEMNKEDYDKLPVVACKYCKSLHIVTDELDNNVCFRCGSVNEFQEFENIYKYEEFVHGKNKYGKEES